MSVKYANVHSRRDFFTHNFRHGAYAQMSKTAGGVRVLETRVTSAMISAADTAQMHRLHIFQPSRLPSPFFFPLAFHRPIRSLSLFLSLSFSFPTSSAVSDPLLTPSLGSTYVARRSHYNPRRGSYPHGRKQKSRETDKLLFERN